MKQLQLLMGMPITVEVVDPGVTEADIANVFAYFRTVDDTFSTYKEHSEISKINRGELREDEYSDDMKTILALSEQTRQETQGYFNIWHNGIADPSGIVKGWAILQAATLLKAAGFTHFYIDAGGDIQVSGSRGDPLWSPDGDPWRIGIRNPFNRNEIVKVLAVTDKGIATSGTAIRGQHIYNPHSLHRGRPLAPIHTANAASAASASHSSRVKGEGSPPLPAPPPPLRGIAHGGSWGLLGLLASPVDYIADGDNYHQGQQNSHANEIDDTFTFGFQTLTAAQKFYQY